MALFTLELWEVLEIEDDPGSGHKIGLGAYPIPSFWKDPDDRDALNKLIIDHYWNREIGFETISIFQQRMMRKMNEIMRLYTQLYETTKITFDPLSTFDLKTVRSDDTTENVSRSTVNHSDNSSTNKTRAVSSTPPQTQLAGNGQYATSVTDGEGSAEAITDATGTDTGTTTGNLDGTSTTTGYQGSASRLLTEYRTTLLNIDMMVVTDLEELFLGIMGNGEEMLPNRRITL